MPRNVSLASLEVQNIMGKPGPPSQPAPPPAPTSQAAPLEAAPPQDVRQYCHVFSVFLIYRHECIM